MGDVIKFDIEIPDEQAQRLGRKEKITAVEVVPYRDVAEQIKKWEWLEWCVRLLAIAVVAEALAVGLLLGRMLW